MREALSEYLSRKVVSIIHNRTPIKYLNLSPSLPQNINQSQNSRAKGLNFLELSTSLSLYGGAGLVIQERHYREGGRGWGRFWRSVDGYESSTGIRAPIGLSWKSDDKNFELSCELYLNLFLTGRDGSDLGLALAGRYYF